MKQDMNAIAASIFAVLFFFFTTLFLLTKTNYAYHETSKPVNHYSTLTKTTDLLFQNIN